MLSFKQMALNAEVIALLQRVGLPTEDLDPVSTTFCGMWKTKCCAGSSRSSRTTVSDC